MKKDYSLEILGCLIILVLLALCVNVYEMEFDEEVIDYKKYDERITSYYDKYLVGVSFEDPSNLNGDYIITPIDYTMYHDAINFVEDYFLWFNKEFFKHFYEYGMNGLEIYFASNISGTKNGYNNASVIGLSFIKNNKYVIVVGLKNKSDVLEIFAHETMHIIDYYLTALDFDYGWNQLNPVGFNYSHVYYKNSVFKDTIAGHTDNNAVYFVDNYARSSENEDRARILEYILLGNSLQEYPALEEKKEHLQNSLLKVFPELKYTKNFYK